MISKTYTILAAEGLHARPAKAFLNAIKALDSNVTLKKGDVTTDAKSMLGILSMQAGYNSEIEIIIEGGDEQAALNQIDHFFTQDIINL